MEIKTVLVTGSDGYIGSVLTQQLLLNSYRVSGIDSLFYNNCNLGRYYREYHLFKKDIRNITKNDLKGFDAIIHLAALSNDPLGEIDQRLTRQINFLATVRLAKLAKKAGAKRFLFSSSCSIYGIAKNGIVDEETKINPLTTYAKSKFLSEQELIQLADKKFCVGILRNSTVYGYSPKFRGDLVVNNLLLSAIVYKEIRVASDGSPWRPLIDVRDLARVFLGFLKADDSLINGKIFNIGFSENNFQVKDIVKVIYKELPDCKVVYTGEHGKDSRSYRVSFKKFQRAFPQLKQEWDLKKSILDMLQRLKKEKITASDLEKFTRLSVLKKLLYEK